MSWKRLFLLLILITAILDYKSVVLADGSEKFTIENGILTAYDYEGEGDIDVVIPNSVKEIGNQAFQYWNLKSVSIPNSVTKIGDYAFLGCINLESVTLPNSLTEIGEEAFRDCAFKSITLPNSLKEIGEAAFDNCCSLESITFPS